MPREGKRQLNVFVSDESFAQLRTFADEQGCSVTALIDAFGQHLQARPPRWLAEVVKTARLIDADRRRRT